jgi:hypothetical protein
MGQKWSKIGICGLSCRLCPMYHIKGESRCSGCKSESRKFVGCTFIKCAIKKKGIEFCWDCEESLICVKWKKHKEFSRHRDSFVCYQKLEDNIRFIQEKGIDEFEKEQKARENLLRNMLSEFNDGRSKTFYCIATTVLEIEELDKAFEEAKKQSEGLEKRKKAKILHRILDRIAERKNYHLKLRK